MIADAQSYESFDVSNTALKWNTRPTGKDCSNHPFLSITDNSFRTRHLGKYECPNKRRFVWHCTPKNRNRFRPHDEDNLASSIGVDAVTNHNVIRQRNGENRGPWLVIIF